MKKITVMIVDDEKLAIDDLMGIVDWDENGFEIIATAVNGKQALSKFRELHPQVVLTDIKMPFMDGIEFIGHLRNIDTKTKVVLLTAYKDFSYAKSAIQHGISDYLIKSEINSNSVTSLLSRLRDRIGSEDKASDMINQKLISDYFISDASDKVPDDIAPFTAPYCYVIIEQDLPLNISGFDLFDRNECSRNRVISLLELNIENDITIAALGGIRYDRVLIALDIHETSQKDIREKLYRYARSIRTCLASNFDSSFTIYTVSLKMSLIKLRKLYLHSADSFQTKYFSGTGAMFELSNVAPIKQQNDIRLDEKRLSSMIESLDCEGVCLYIDELFDLANGNYLGLCGISRSLYENLRKYFDLLPDNVAHIIITAEKNSSHWLNAPSLRQWFYESFRDLVIAKKEVNESGYSKVIIMAINFICCNFQKNDLSIKLIADKVHLSTGHLCSVFKKETGMTLNDYVTEVRIAAAKKQLEESSMKIYEISTAVGFQSSQYFSQVFFKKEGVLPAEYQKGRSGAENSPHLRKPGKDLRML